MNRFDTENNRPISSLNKLTRIKKNIFPHLINSQSSSHMRDNSFSHNSKNKYSTIPINTEPELLQSENIQLKTGLNKIKSELMLAKIEIKSLEKEISKKDKMIHELLPNDFHNPNGSVNINSSQLDSQGKIIESQIIHQLKKQFKDLRKEYEDKANEYEEIKKTLKNTKVNELIIENNILTDQFEKMKELYLTSQETIMILEKNTDEIISMKEALSKQDFIILNFQESYQKMQEEIREKTAEIERLSKTKVEKQEAINRLNKKLNFQCQVNDKLITTTENIPGTKEYLVMKRELEVKVNELKRDVTAYKEDIEKKDKIIKDLRKNDYVNYLQLGKGNDNESKIFNLQNKLSCEKEERIRLQNKVKQLGRDKNYIINNSNNNKGNVGSGNNNFHHNSIQIYDRLYNSTAINSEDEECDYMSDNLLNEYIYILLKNFEAKKIDAIYIEANIINQDALALLSNDSTIKEFILSIASNICKILSILKSNDQLELLAFMKTIIYNYYLCNSIKSIEEFKAKFMNCFEGIIFYSKDQCENYNKKLITKLCNKKEGIEKEFAFFDENKTGLITFTALKKIFDRIKFSLNNDLLEYLIYLMKAHDDGSNNNEGISIRKLNYTVVLRMLNDNKNLQQTQTGEEESMIEITNDEYLAKVTETITKIKKTITDSKKPFEILFSIDQSLKVIKGKDSIALSKVIQILKETFNLELNHLEIFCLYSKVRFDDEKEGNKTDQNNTNTNEETIDDIIDYTKFKNEFEESKPNLNANNGIKLLQVANVVSECFSNDKIDLKRNILINNILNSLKERNISFERLIFPFHCKMKLEMTSGKYNRYLELNLFKEMLIKNNIQFSYNTLITFFISNELMFIHDKVNLDYLKVLLIVNSEEDKATSFDKEDIYEEIKDNKGNDFELGNIEDESESFKQIQKDIYCDEDDYEEDNKK